jgi:hypothetical protein
MSKQAFEGIMQGLEEALACTRGDKSAVARVVNVAVKPADINTARKKTGMSREAFARAFGLAPQPCESEKTVNDSPQAVSYVCARRADMSNPVPRVTFWGRRLESNVAASRDIQLACPYVPFEVHSISLARRRQKELEQ